MVIVPKIRGFICVTAHPEGCAAHIQQQIDYVRSKGPIAGAPKRVLVIGSSTGYGLASRITAAFGGGASTMGVFFEKAAEGGKLGTAGWYNSVAFELAAKKAGLYARSFNGDAFSDELKAQVVEAIRADWGSVDQVVYSLASPRRTNPRTGITHRSCLKPIGRSYTSKNLTTDKEEVNEITIEPATEEDVAETVAVMGGEDWRWWIDALEEGGVLAPGAGTVAYSYIGPELTYPIYRNGTIGIAKGDLEKTALALHERLARSTGGYAYVSVNKALVTQASSAIPVVPLYISALYKVMKAEGLHEGCIEQIQRLYATRLFGAASREVDEKNRIRMDDWETKREVQAAVAGLWDKITTENLRETTDFDGYQAEFLKLFGFGLPGVDYEAESDPEKINGEPAVLG
jgi:enoyl-[acyl-carrier protein] reductase/trans-2-enoyl-CoA reductase (NAD+)